MALIKYLRCFSIYDLTNTVFYTSNVNWIGVDKRLPQWLELKSYIQNEKSASTCLLFFLNWNIIDNWYKLNHQIWLCAMVHIIMYQQIIHIPNIIYSWWVSANIESLIYELCSFKFNWVHSFLSLIIIFSSVWRAQCSSPYWMLKDCLLKTFGKRCKIS